MSIQNSQTELIDMCEINHENLDAPPSSSRRKIRSNMRSKFIDKKKDWVKDELKYHKELCVTLKKYNSLLEDRLSKYELVRSKFYLKISS